MGHVTIDHVVLALSAYSIDRRSNFGLAADNTEGKMCPRENVISKNIQPNNRQLEIQGGPKNKPLSGIIIKSY